MAPPLVSIVIPCFNGERFVGDAIRSALAQTFRDREVIVVDDGSTDGSREAVRRFGQEVRLVEAGHRGGSAARNRGLGVAQGEWIQFLDADDLLAPHKLERHIAHRAAQPDAIGYADCEMSFLERPGEPPSPMTTKADDDAVVFVLNNTLQTSTPLHLRSWLERVGGFREGLPCCQEFDLHLRLACAGARFRHLPETLCTRRTRHDSVSASYVRHHETAAGDPVGRLPDSSRETAD
jgi:glycosyltransferase involved in cell wall biosynthesis